MKLIGLIIAAAALVLAQVEAPLGQPEVKVTVQKKTEGALYLYRLLHKGKTGVITGITIGCDDTNPDADCELKSRPAGVIIPSDWNAQVVRVEEQALWGIRATNTQKPIAPDKSACAIGVWANSFVEQYRTTAVTVYFGDGRKRSGRLTDESAASSCDIVPLALTHPRLGDPVRGRVPITATAVDANANFNSIQLAVDGVPTGQPIASVPAQFDWDSSKVSNGEHAISVRGVTVDGRERETGGLTVIVDN